jgi:hypothetical protein
VIFQLHRQVFVVRRDELEAMRQRLEELVPLPLAA